MAECISDVQKEITGLRTPPTFGIIVWGTTACVSRYPLVKIRTTEAATNNIQDDLRPQAFPFMQTSEKGIMLYY